LKKLRKPQLPRKITKVLEKTKMTNKSKRKTPFSKEIESTKLLDGGKSCSTPGLLTSLLLPRRES
jgi:hypothetical protein